jgi:type I restriction enzyme M protein
MKLQNTKTIPAFKANKNMNYNQNNHKEIFRNIHNYLVGQFVGGSRERALLDEMLKMLFCKIYLLKKSNNKNHVNIDSITLSKEYREVFSELKITLPGIFEREDEILLSVDSISFINTELNKVDLAKPGRDPFGDLYEVFIGTGVREEEGQFFTPKNGIDLLINFVNPNKKDRIIDPACGAGGFLTNSMLHIGDKNNPENIYGIEKDSYLQKLATTHIALLSMSTGCVSTGDSLSWKDTSNNTLNIDHSDYDVVLTNPPFGKKIVAATKDVQKRFDLGYKWKFDKDQDLYIKTTELQRSTPPQVLFVERCIKLLKPGGRLGIVLPESLITSKSYAYVVQYMLENCSIKSVIGMPEDFFKTSGKGGTHTKACLLTLIKKNGKQGKNEKIFFAEAKWCGHDSRGRTIEKDDLPEIYQNYKLFTENKLKSKSLLGYSIKLSDLNGTILSPRYYNPAISEVTNKLNKTHNITTIRELVDAGVLKIKTGDEVGKMVYGTGTIPFVRTSDISNWEIKTSPKHGVSQEVYEEYKDKQDVQENDIFMVKDGTYLIGTCAIASKYDTKIVYQSHLYKIRVLKPEVISPFLLLGILGSKPVKEQIQSKRFTQDIIDSIGDRLYELKIAIPKDKKLRKKIMSVIKQSIYDRIRSRELSRAACLEVAGLPHQ